MNIEIADCIYNRANDIELAVSAHDEFSSVADYIWKAPRLLDQEKQSELDKLPIYFPNNPELAEIRWRHESRKLENTFPYIMANGNLFAVASLYESYLMLLAKDIEKATGIELDSINGRGNSRLSNYFKHVGINCSSIELYHQVDAALKIRNCLVHASGILDWSKENNVLRQIYKSGTFLSKEHRRLRKSNGSALNEISIVKSELGERIQITNEYSWLSCWYFRDYFLGLCIEARDLEK